MNEKQRYVPRTEIEMNLITTDSEWGRDSVSDDLKKRLTKYYKTPNGEIEEENLWGLLNFFTRDIRLGNLGSKELEEARHYINLANDCLIEGQYEAFVISIERVAAILELSQSKGGFLRKWMQTTRQESAEGKIEPEKKRLFGKKSRG